MKMTDNTNEEPKMTKSKPKDKEESYQDTVYQASDYGQTTHKLHDNQSHHIMSQLPMAL